MSYENNNDNRKNVGKIPATAYTPTCLEPVYCGYECTVQQIKDYLAKEISRYLKNVRPKDICAVIAVDRSATEYDPASKKNKPVKTASFQVVLSADDPALVLQKEKNDENDNNSRPANDTSNNVISDMIGNYIPSYSKEYETVVQKFCGTGDKLEKAIRTETVHGKKLKVIVLNTKRVFEEFIDAQGFLHQKQFGGNREICSVDVKLVPKMEYADEAGHLNINNSASMEKVISYIRIEKSKLKAQERDFNGIMNPKKIRVK